MRVLVAVDPGGIESKVLDVTKRVFEGHPNAEYSIVHVQLMEDDTVKTLINEVELWAQSVDADVDVDIQTPYQMSDAPIREEVGQILLDDAERLDVDHLVIGVRERGPLYRFFHGSTANRVLSARSRSFPVTVVPENAENRQHLETRQKNSR